MQAKQTNNKQLSSYIWYFCLCLQIANDGIIIQNFQRETYIKLPIQLSTITGPKTIFRLLFYVILSWKLHFSYFIIFIKIKYRTMRRHCAPFRIWFSSPNLYIRQDNILRILPITNITRDKILHYSALRNSSSETGLSLILSRNIYLSYILFYFVKWKI